MQRQTSNEAVLNDNILFEKKCLEIESWLARIESRFEHMAPIGHTVDVLEAQLREQKLFFSEFNQYKFQIDQFNDLTQRLLTFYQNESKAVRIKKIADSIYQHYVRLSASIINRGKCLHSAINSLQNFDQSLDKFLAWMSEMESSLESLDTNIDKILDSDQKYAFLKQQLKDLQTEIENHADIYNQLRSNSVKLLNSLSRQDDTNMLQVRVDKLDDRWLNLKTNVINILNRLENNDEYWNALLLSLRELIEWVIRKDTELSGIMSETASSIYKQVDDHRAFRQQIEDKRPIVDSNLLNGRQILANELNIEDKKTNRTKFWNLDETNKELTRNIRREVSKLSEKWNALIERSDQWSKKLEKNISMLSNFQISLDELFKNICALEKASLTWSSPRTAAEAKEMLQQLEQLEIDLAPLQQILKDIKEQMLMFSATGVMLPNDIASQLDDCTARWKALTAAVDDRYKQLSSCSQGDLSPNQDGKIVSSVEPPWERTLTANKVPYYISHSTESTHWDHPKMLSLMNDLLVLNEIRYSAYRTALKLRTLQKGLCLDLITLQIALKSFDLHGLRAQNDKLIDVPDMILVLRAMFVDTVNVYPQIINQPLCVDLVLNWMLNVYDSQRTGQIRVLSFKVGLILMCNGSLEEKYKYLYRIIADPEQKVEQRKLGLLLHDIIQIPRQLGEVAAFGGSNIEPSVRSCFKLASPSNKIEAMHFLSWLQQEPQSLVWLPVLHRIFVSETIKHNIKCNICKQYPIIGLRYRCLKCLNFDMCQNCFFLCRTINGHKFSHPLHEYCLPTSSIEDIRDFVRALCNKFRSKHYFKKNFRLGYLPVRTILEGDELESVVPSPQYPGSYNYSNYCDGNEEHKLIAKYCHSLNSKTDFMLRDKVDSLCSPGQLIVAINEEQRDELQSIIKGLELENETLQKEYDKLKLHQLNSRNLSDSEFSDNDQEIINEAKKLRQHKNRLETRMQILEDHNRQLETQLRRLRQLLEDPVQPMLQTRSVTASQLCIESPNENVMPNLSFFNT